MRAICASMRDTRGLCVPYRWVCGASCVAKRDKYANMRGQACESVPDRWHMRGYKRVNAGLHKKCSGRP